MQKFLKVLKRQKVERKEYLPEFIPKLKKDGDVSNFDKMFTDMDPFSYKDKGKLVNHLGKIGKSPTEGVSYENFTYVKNVV